MSYKEKIIKLLDLIEESRFKEIYKMLGSKGYFRKMNCAISTK